jgi:hypothetical protein
MSGISLEELTKKTEEAKNGTQSNDGANDKGADAAAAAAAAAADAAASENAAREKQIQEAAELARKKALEEEVWASPVLQKFGIKSQQELEGLVSERQRLLDERNAIVMSVQARSDVDAETAAFLNFKKSTGVSDYATYQAFMETAKKIEAGTATDEEIAVTAIRVKKPDIAKDLQALTARVRDDFEINDNGVAESTTQIAALDAFKTNLLSIKKEVEKVDGEAENSQKNILDKVLQQREKNKEVWGASLSHMANKLLEMPEVPIHEHEGIKVSVKPTKEQVTEIQQRLMHSMLMKGIEPNEDGFKVAAAELNNELIARNLDVVMENYHVQKTMAEDAKKRNLEGIDRSGGGSDGKSGYEAMAERMIKGDKK